MTDGRAETYLRLRAEAELRRVQKLPLPEPDDALPRPVRAAAELLRPAAEAATAAAAPVLPTVSRAAETLQPLAGEAARRLQPLAAEAERRLQPLADEATRRLQPLAEEAERRARLLADETARRLRPLRGQAADTLRPLQLAVAGHLPRWRWQLAQATEPLRRRAGVRAARRWPAWTEPSAEEGEYRLSRVADALVLAGALDRAVADSILAELETALLARKRIDQSDMFLRDFRRRQRPQPPAAPAGTYRAVPIGVTVPPDPAVGLGETKLFALVITPDQALLTATGTRPASLEEPGPQHPLWPMQAGSGDPAIVDDRGQRYQLDLGNGNSDNKHWSATMRISPVPPAGTGWLELTLSPGYAPIRVDLPGPADQDDGRSGPARDPSPVGGLLDSVAESLLFAAAGSIGPPEHDLTEIAEIVAALAAAGALEPAQAAVDRLVALARRLGTEIPAVLRDAARPGPGAELPEAWTSVLANRHRRDGPAGAAAVAAVLPELDGCRFAVAGLESNAAGAELSLLGWGPMPWPSLAGAGHIPELHSWLARDDTGRWQVASEGSGGYSDAECHLQLLLRPPLHPDATSLEVILAGPAGQVSATMPLRWLGPGPSGREQA